MSDASLNSPLDPQWWALEGVHQQLVILIERARKLVFTASRDSDLERASLLVQMARDSLHEASAILDAHSKACDCERLRELSRSVTREGPTIVWPPRRRNKSEAAS